MDTSSVTTFIKSRSFLALIFTIIIVGVIVAAFAFGMDVGYQRARISYAWGEQYTNVFGGPRGGFIRDMTGREYIEAHGEVGSILKTDGNTLILSGRDGAEREVIIGPETVTRLFHDDVPATSLRVGQTIVVVGVPDEANGSLAAQLIRVIPPPPATPAAAVHIMNQ